MQPQRWHVPHLDHGLGLQRDDDRPRTVEPARCFVETDLQRLVIAATADLRLEPVPMLLVLLADPEATLPMRIAAGNLLALAGDPRIDPLAPDMIDIAGGDVAIGLAVEEIDAVTAWFAHLGIDRSWIAKEAPRHVRRLAPYRLARYPVTNAEYRLFLVETGHSDLPTSWAFRRYPSERPIIPSIRSRPPRRRPMPRGCRIGRAGPSACRARRNGNMQQQGATGSNFPGATVSIPPLPIRPNADCWTHRPSGRSWVGSPFGLSDMGGNVEEYVADDYGLSGRRDHCRSPEPDSRALSRGARRRLFPFRSGADAAAAWSQPEIGNLCHGLRLAETPR
jgi:formylglycine-generating enzyme required for sulfatase activity